MGDHRNTASQIGVILRTNSKEILGQLYVFRAPTCGEMIEARTRQEAEAQEFICSKCTLYPVGIDWDMIAAGVPTVISQEILELGGLTETSYPLLEASIKEWADSQAGKQEILIMCILGYTPDQISEFDNYTWNKAATAAVVGAQLKQLPIDKFLNPKPTHTRRNQVNYTQQ